MDYESGCLIGLNWWARLDSNPNVNLTGIRSSHNLLNSLICLIILETNNMQLVAYCKNKKVDVVRSTLLFLSKLSSSIS
jgi:hypothetical protein